MLMRGSKAAVLCSQLAARYAARHREDVEVGRLRGVAVDESTNEALHVGSEGCVIATITQHQERSYTLRCHD
jgi:TctA family transporter